MSKPSAPTTSQPPVPCEVIDNPFSSLKNVDPVADGQTISFNLLCLVILRVSPILPRDLKPPEGFIPDDQLAIPATRSRTSTIFFQNSTRTLPIVPSLGAEFQISYPESLTGCNVQWESPMMLKGPRLGFPLFWHTTMAALYR
ncbi:hypothetical protein Hypma_005185 [Hypsizygus marmoreus]|uniref:Uncharacterized protein n=1 Tax=Hypsizygus marmoreus TaxID=39966 RepID=A0A369J415_HYPMA|nr:hypothetical protein Hypma_005185 [Hypsizygus marmoreus]